MCILLFPLEAAFSILIHVSHIKWRPRVLKLISFTFLLYFAVIKNGSLHYFNDCFCIKISSAQVFMSYVMGIES